MEQISKQVLKVIKKWQSVRNSSKKLIVSFVCYDFIVTFAINKENKTNASLHEMVR